MPPIRAHLVSHTHWDRAWYLPFQRFRVHLVELVDGLLELLEGSPEFGSFTLDGQMALLDDYLAVRPENRQRIAALVAAGRLEIGPWFVLPDAFLPSGESLIRNLELGLERARAFGADPVDGYMPDSFGHIAQMPQILRGFGLRSFVFMRGMPEDAWERLGCEFTWRAPDGSEVLALYLRESYLDSSALGMPDAFGDFEGHEPDPEAGARRIRDSLASRLQATPSGLHLLLNGCDHMPVQKELPDLLARMEKSLPGVELVHTSLRAHLDGVLAAEASRGVFTGDLLGNAHHPVLSSVWSTRLPLKQANARAEWLLTDVAEPVAALAGAAGGRFLSQLQEAWRLLLLNHPHDDICGCSVDEVHRENMVRFAEVQQIAGEVAGECVRELARRHGLVQQQGVVWVAVWQPDRTTESQVVEAEVFLPAAKERYVQDSSGAPQPPANKPAAVGSLVLHGPDGELVPVQILARDEEAFRARHIDTGAGTRFRVAFRVPAAAGGQLSWWRFQADPRRAEIPAHGAVSRTAELGNDDWSVQVHPDGRLDLRHRQTGVQLGDAIYLQDEVDAGDTYSFSPRPAVQGASTREHMPESVEVQGAGAVFHSVRLRWRLPRPGGLDDPAPKALPVVLELRLPVGSGDPEVLVEVDNTVRDHRLRLHIGVPGDGTGGSAGGRALAGAAFGFTEREAVPAMQPTPAKGYPGEVTYPCLFSRDVLLVPGANGDLVVAHPGLHEFELQRGSEGQSEVAITVLRAVGMLSRGDGLWRRCQAGPSLPTPQAQCPGPHRVRLALGMLPPGSSHGQAVRRVRGHCRPPWVHEARLAPSGRPSQGSPGTQPALQLSNPAVEVTSLRLLPDGDLLLRLANRADTHCPVELQPGSGILGGDALVNVCATDLAGRPIAPVRIESGTVEAGTVEAGMVRLDLPPQGLQSLRLQRGAKTPP